MAQILTKFKPTIYIYFSGNLTLFSTFVWLGFIIWSREKFTTVICCFRFVVKLVLEHFWHNLPFRFYNYNYIWCFKSWLFIKRISWRFCFEDLICIFFINICSVNPVGVYDLSIWQSKRARSIHAKVFPLPPIYSSIWPVILSKAIYFIKLKLPLIIF